MTLRHYFLLAAGLLVFGSLGAAWWAWRQGLVTASAARSANVHHAPGQQPTAAPEEAPGAAAVAPPTPREPEVRAAIPVDSATLQTRPGRSARISPIADAVAPKPFPDTWATLSGPGAFRLHVWSPEPLAEGLKPPASLLGEEWRDAVLTSTGGAALLKDKSVAAWRQEAPGTAVSFSFPDGATDLQATPDEVLVRCRNGAVYLLPEDGAGSPRLVAERIRALYPSARPGQMAAFDADSQMTLLQLDQAASPKTLPARWRASHQPAALTADGKLWALSSEAKLWLLQPDGTTFESVDEGPLSDIKPMGAAIAAIDTDSLSLLGFNGAAAPPGNFAARRLLAVDGMAVAINDGNEAVAWGARVPESPRSLKLPEGTWQARVGPSGLMIAW